MMADLNFMASPRLRGMVLKAPDASNPAGDEPGIEDKAEGQPDEQGQGPTSGTGGR